MSNESIEIGRLWAPMNRIADAIVPRLREPFINLPGLRGYWPMSAVDFLGNAKDHSAGSSDLSRSGTPKFGYDGNGFVQTGNATDYLAGSVSAQTVTGVEVWMDPLIRGVTVGCWVNVSSTPASQAGMVSRQSGAGQRSFMLLWSSSDVAHFFVSNDGSATVSVASAAQGLSMWHFVVGRFTPSTEIAIFVDGIKSINTTSIPASLFVGTSPFEVGRINTTAAQILDGKIRDVFLCSSILSDELIEKIRISSLPG